MVRREPIVNESDEGEHSQGKKRRYYTGRYQYAKSLRLWYGDKRNGKSQYDVVAEKVVTM